MSTETDSREIPAGEQELIYHRLIPIAKLLIERGHLPIRNKHKYGFCPSPGDMTCSASGSLPRTGPRSTSGSCSRTTSSTTTA